MTFSLTIKTQDDLQAEALAELQVRIVASVDAHVENQAKSMGYNSAAALAGYRDSTVAAWASESQVFLAWRDAVWLAVYDQQSAHESAQTVPTINDMIDALPEWPG